MLPCRHGWGLITLAHPLSYLPHGQGFHAILLPALTELLDHSPQEFYALVRVAAEVVRVPPQMEDASSPCGSTHRLSHPSQPEWLERGQPPRIRANRESRTHIAQPAGLQHFAPPDCGELEDREICIQ